MSFLIALYEAAQTAAVAELKTHQNVIVFAIPELPLLAAAIDDENVLEDVTLPARDGVVEAHPPSLSQRPKPFAEVSWYSSGAFADEQFPPFPFSQRLQPGILVAFSCIVEALMPQSVRNEPL